MASCPSTVSADLRTTARRLVKLHAQVREVGSRRIEIELLNLSVSGFSFESFSHFELGSRVFLSIPSFAPLEARIMWCTEFHFGCQFTHPLHVSVFETIAQRFG